VSGVLDLTVELYLGTTWVDVTGYVRATRDLTVSRGRSDPRSRSTPCEITLVADNAGGRWSPSYPLGAWYGLIRLGTPIRVTWTVDAVDYVIGEAELTSLPVGRDMSGRVVDVTVTAKGTLSRLQSSRPPKLSPAYRFHRLPGVASRLLHYWPLESGVVGGPLDAAVGGSRARVVKGTPDFDAYKDHPGSFGMANLADAQIQSTFRSLGATDWTLSFLTHATGDGLWTPIRLYMSTGGIGWWDISTSGTQTYATWTDTSGSSTGSVCTLNVGLTDGRPHYVVLSATYGATTDVALTVDNVSAWVGVAISGGSPGGLWRLNPASQSVEGQVSHIAMWSGTAPLSTGLSDYGAAATGGRNEQAISRFSRCCQESGIGASTSGTESPQMGPQVKGTLLDIFDEIEDTTQGWIDDSLSGRTINIYSLDGVYNQTPTVTLDYAAGHLAVDPVVTEPSLEDVANTVAATRTGGSTYVYTVTTGRFAASTTTGIGVVDGSITASLASDEQLPALAGLVANRSCLDRPVVDAISVLLHADVVAPVLPDILGGDLLGTRLRVTGLPYEYGSPTRDFLVVGTKIVFRSQTVAALELSVEAWEPYDVGIAASTTTSSGIKHLDVLTSTTATLSTTGTSVTVSSSTVWVTSTDSYPVDVLIGGERVTVSACTGSGSPQTLTISARAVDGYQWAHTTGSTVQIHDSDVFKLAY